MLLESRIDTSLLVKRSHVQAKKEDQHVQRDSEKEPPRLRMGRPHRRLLKIAQREEYARLIMKGPYESHPSLPIRTVYIVVIRNRSLSAIAATPTRASTPGIR